MINIDKIKALKIAYVHDWLTGMRGGEKVLEQMIAVLGPRDLYTLVANKKELSDTINSCTIKTSIIQKLPFASTKHQYYLPLFPMAIENFDFKEYDLVISTSHCVAKGIVTYPNTFHYSYVHTPIRYAWDFSAIYQKKAKPKWLMKFAWPLFMHYLRMWDKNTCDRVDHYVPNAINVKRRIEKYYRRDAEVLYPPVDMKAFYPNENPSRDYYFILSALVPYKRVDLAIETCKKLGKRLIVAGGGPELDNLKRLAGSSNIEILGRVSQEKILDLYQNAKAFLFPGEEDFGITPLESQACATPVIAFKKGGALETVIENKTGLFFKEQTYESLSEAILTFEKKTFEKKDLVNHAMSFSNEVFCKKFSESVEKSYTSYLKRMDF
ncbi:MAG: glycosyl transferase [Candidatus Cloacimonadota bacterium]|nr:MAG: glycosyl transferase [Candidatus Cloacimonadota bacterium]